MLSWCYWAPSVPIQYPPHHCTTTTRLNRWYKTGWMFACFYPNSDLIIRILQQKSKICHHHSKEQTAIIPPTFQAQCIHRQVDKHGGAGGESEKQVQYYLSKSANQWSCWRTGEIYSTEAVLVVTRATTFWTSWRLWRSNQEKTELQ